MAERDAAAQPRQSETRVADERAGRSATAPAGAGEPTARSKDRPRRTRRPARPRRPAPQVGDELRATAAAVPGDLAVACEDRCWTWRELDDAADAAAELSRDAVVGLGPVAGPGDGEKPGDEKPSHEKPGHEKPGHEKPGHEKPSGPPGSGFVGALSLPPGPAAIATLFGLWRAGLAAAPLHHRLADAELDHALRLVRPALWFSNDRAAEPDPDPDHELPAPSTGLATLSPAPCPAPSARDRPLVPLRLHQFPEVEVLLLTSGASGGPKAVGLSRAAFAAGTAASVQRLSLEPSDKWGLCLSLGHVGGLALVLRAVSLGCSIRCWPRFDAEAVATAVLAGAVTHLSLVPTMLWQLLDALAGRTAPASFRCVLVGGAALSPALLERAVAAGLPVAPTWGMTETASQIATAPPALAERRPGTVGPPLPGIEARAEPGTRVLAVRGPTLASMVVRRPGEEPKALPVDGDGWFRTADLGRADADGNLWIEGRADDAVVTGGVTVAPSEVEQAIQTLPGVSDAVVFGAPDEVWGHTLHAVVEANPAALAPEDVHRHCRARLSRARRPSTIRIVESLPRTPTGKADRAAVAKSGPKAAGGGTPR